MAGLVIDWHGVDPSLLEPVFRADVEQLLAESPYLWRVTSGYRSPEYQQVLYEKYLAGGPKAAPPGKSAHNWGLAIDVVPDGHPDIAGFQPDWQPNPGDAWYWLREAVAAHPRLHHGSAFGDWPHIERYQWKQHKPEPPPIAA